MIIEINNEKRENDGLHYKHLHESNMCIDERKSELVKALKTAREGRRIAAQKYKLPEYIDSPENFFGGHLGGHFGFRLFFPIHAYFFRVA